LHGPEAFPCKKSEEKKVKERLPARKAVVVPELLICILRRGGYRNLDDEEDALYTAENASLRDLGSNASIRRIIRLAMRCRMQQAGKKILVRGT
jgi:hypothetical protein